MNWVLFPCTELEIKTSCKENNLALHHLHLVYIYIYTYIIHYRCIVYIHAYTHTSIKHRWRISCVPILTYLFGLAASPVAWLRSKICTASSPYSLPLKTWTVHKCCHPTLTDKTNSPEQGYTWSWIYQTPSQEHEAQFWQLGIWKANICKSLLSYTSHHWRCCAIWKRASLPHFQKLVFF